MHTPFGKFLIVLALAPWTVVASAENHDVIGPTYPIQEEDAIVTLKRKLTQMETSGELAKIQEEAKQRVVRNIEEPAPVAGIAEVMTRSVRYFDPSITVERSIADPTGRVIVAAGTRINPLDHVGLSKRLVFFDGRDKVQVQKVKSMVDVGGSKVKPILVAGSFMKLMRSWKTQVYFDQYGKLTDKFGITKVPAVVSQAGKRLKIEEVPSEELK